jgi:hypothetical protein
MQEMKYASLTHKLWSPLTPNSFSLANFVWAFDFSPARTPTGEVIPPDLWDFTNGITFAPRPFKTTITVRSPAKREIIRRHFLAQTPLFTPFERDLQPQDAAYVQGTREAMGN